MKLKGKVALVTGSAQGIGKSIAEALAKEGADIIVSDINLELAEKTAGEISSLGVKAKALRMDVADSRDVEEKVKDAISQFGKIDILVNNAGITKDALLVRMREEDFDSVIKVNLKGTYNLIRAISPLMMKARSGKIVNIASVVGQMGNVGQANYAASKAGIIGLTKTAAKELARRGINVNAVAPGFIDTEMTKRLPEEVRTKLKEAIPLERLGAPEDVASAVLFLASDDSNYITGQVINVNGGML